MSIKTVPELLDHLVELKIVADVDKFRAVLDEHKFELSKEMVYAIGYEGVEKYVRIDNPDIFTCCGCDNYCVSDYDGRCDECKKLRCYNCATGGAERGRCANKQKEDDDDDEEKSSSRKRKKESK